MAERPGRPPDSFPARVFRFVRDASEKELEALDLAIELGKVQRNGETPKRTRKTTQEHSGTGELVDLREPAG